jgi:pyridoxine kinase
MTAAPRLALTIQSHVAWGHVGNSAAVLPLQRLGIEAIPIHTVQFSNHTGYGEFKGQVFPASHIRDVLEGLQARGVLARCDAVLSGYLGDPGTGEAILEAVASIRQVRPQVRYLCDPVMGDTGRGLFVRPGIPEFLRQRALPSTDILTPNQFEFELLVGHAVESVGAAVDGARSLLRRPPGRPGPELIVITSLRTADLPPDSIHTLAVTADRAWTVRTPHIELSPMPNGMGDVFASVLLGCLLNGSPVPEALAHAVSCLYGLISELPQGGRDLPLVAAQHQIVHPTTAFHAVEV